jgi:hypothetical protein
MSAMKALKEELISSPRLLSVSWAYGNFEWI